MREPSKNEIGKAVIALINLETYVNKGWKIPIATKELIRNLINNLRFQYQFSK